MAGWASWPALLKDLKGMPAPVHTASIPGVALTGAEPMLLVADVSASLDFYTSKLGFDVLFSYGEPVFYAQNQQRPR